VDTARRPDETEREWLMRLRAESRDRQYNELKRYSMWAAAWAALATIAAVVLGARGR
jgi:hypothetical protein